MNLLLPLVAVGAYVVLHKPKARLVAVATSGPTLIPSAASSIIQVAPGAIPAVKGETAVGSPIEQAGYIPPVVKTPGPSAVALGRLAACGCGPGCRGGLGAARQDRQALRAALEALKAKYGPLIDAAIRAKDRATIDQATKALADQTAAALGDYHAAHPEDHATRLARSVSPVFMGPERRRG